MAAAQDLELSLPGLPGRPGRADRARARLWRPWGEGTAGELARWCQQGAPEGHELRAGRVWRVRDLVVKRAGGERPGRSSSARRAARAAQRLAALGLAELGIAAPRALVEWGPRWRIAGSLLVSDWVEGRALFEVWGRDEAALAAFPALISSLHAHGVYHADFHPENVLWDGRRWNLIDLEAVRTRPPWRPWRRIAVEQWARVLRALDYDARVEALYGVYCTLANASGAARLDAASWSSVVGAARALPPIPAEVLAGIRARLAR